MRYLFICTCLSIIISLFLWNHFFMEPIWKRNIREPVNRFKNVRNTQSFEPIGKLHEWEIINRFKNLKNSQVFGNHMTKFGPNLACFDRRYLPVLIRTVRVMLKMYARSPVLNLQFLILRCRSSPRLCSSMTIQHRSLYLKSI
jgi:hypothetical protein